MSRGFFRRENEIERTLRGARPHASDELLDRLASRARAVPTRAPRRLGMRLAGAAGVTALMVVGLSATGGISYAASTVDHVVAQVTHHSTFMGARMAVAVKQTSPSSDQYTTGGKSSSPQTVGGDLGGAGNLLSTAASKSGPSIITLGSPVKSTGTKGETITNTLSATVTSDTVTLNVQSTSSATPGTTKTLTSVQVPKATFDALLGGTGANKVASVVVDPKPKVSAVTSQPLIGTTLEFQNSAGQPVHLSGLKDPIAVTIPGPFPAGYQPAFSTNGATFTAIGYLGKGVTSLGPKQDTGYYLEPAGSTLTTATDLVILTRHTTIFAAVSRVDLGVSESGRKLKKAGSGLFGDPLLIHPGPAVLKQIGKKVAVYPFRTLKGDAVKFDFFVDEQVSAYIQLFKGNKRIPIDLHGTQIRGGTISKERTIKTLHISVLRPGTLPIRLHVPASKVKRGAKYRIRVSAIDFDGNKTVRFIPFTG